MKKEQTRMDENKVSEHSMLWFAMQQRHSQSKQDEVFKYFSLWASLWVHN